MTDIQDRWRWVVVAAMVGGCGSGGGAGARPDGAVDTMQVQQGGADGSAGGGTGGTGGGTGGAGCPAQASFTQADHIVMQVTWPAGTGTTMGTGQVHIWNKTALSVSGNNLTGTLQPCGSVLPPAQLVALAGGGSILIEVPDAEWDLPTMPRFDVQGTQGGADTGSTLGYSWAALLGLTLADPNAAWPASYTGITMTTNPDGDPNPGFTALPRNGNGFVLPPTAISLLPARADQIYLVTRNAAAATLTRSACDAASGTVAVTHFDSHVVGCHISGGAGCMPAQTNFVDANRTIYQVTSATIQSKTVAATATCADVRAALPMM